MSLATPRHGVGRVVLCLATLFGLLPAIAVGAQGVPVRDTAAIERRLVSATGSSRIPLLADLVFIRREEPDRAIPLADEALALLAKAPSPALETRVRTDRAWALQVRGDYAAAIGEAHRAESVARSSGDEALLGEATFTLGWVQWKRAEYDEAMTNALRARDIQRAHGTADAYARALSLIGAIHYLRGELEGALEGYLAALHVADSVHDEVAAARAHNNIGLVYLDLNRADEGLAALRRALAIHERVGPRGPLTNTLNNIGLALIELGRPREALPYLERAYAMDREVGNLFGEAKELSNIGGVQEKLGRPDLAQQYHERALALRRQIGDRDGVVRTMGALADVRVQRGDARGAIPLYESGIALADSIGDARDAADQLELLAKARLSLGDTARAFLDYRRFHERRDAMGDSASRARIIELEAKYRAREQERAVASLSAIAATRQGWMRALAAAVVLLVLLLGLLGIMHAKRARAQEAQAESERKYRTLFEASPLAYILVDVGSRRVLDLNLPARALCEVPPAAHPGIDEIRVAWVREALGRLLDAGVREAEAHEASWQDATGRTRWAELRAGTLTLAGRACRLVTVRETTQERLAEAARQREDKLQSLGALAGGIAHDFNNVLAGIVGHVALAREADPGERDTMLATAERAALGARRLTGQLLAFAKGGQPLRQVVNVGHALRDAVSLAGAGSHLRIDVEVADDLWRGHLDVGQFNQVVSNLVLNARDATGEGGRLLVRASNFTGDIVTGAPGDARRYVRIEFADNGSGVPAAVRSRVFDPYFTTKAGGSGLGLATSFAICRNHGGALVLEDGPRPGATFTAYFPATEAPVATETASATPDEQGAGGSVLVLDDDPLVRTVLERMLVQDGFDVESVADGREAVARHAERRATGRPFDLLIMDLTIPGGMGGRAALAEILRSDPDARAIVASGYSDDPTMANYRSAGFRAALTKPFNREELTRTVRVVLQGAGAEAG